MVPRASYEVDVVQAGSHQNDGALTRDLAAFVRAALLLSEVVAWMLGIVLVLRGELAWAAGCVAFALASDFAGRAWSRRSPVPMPYFLRWILWLPRGPQSPRGLISVLRPRSGERILEIGPGIGIHALPVAALLLPDGVLDALDVQAEMVAALERSAADRGLRNVVPTRGDAQRLPYGNETFDAVYLMSVLGEVPDAAAALHELRRVLKPDGRVVVGEVVIDPDFISLPRLREMAAAAGLVFERSSGPAFLYLGVFRRAAAMAAPERTEA